MFRSRKGVNGIILLILVISFPYLACSQGKKEKIVTVGFYNLENLFDTIDDPATDDQQFTPSGSGKWDSQRYKTKLEHLAGTIRQIGNETVPGPPVLVGLAEVENRQVLEDLIRTHPLKDAGYRIVHHDSPDKRGIDVALLYIPAVCKIINSKPVPLTLKDNPDFSTRDILVVSLELSGQSLEVMVNHWPSRSKGEKESAPLRIAAANLCRSLFDSIQKAEPRSGVIILGDFNDDPVNESLMKHLGTEVIPDSVQEGDLYNPMWSLFNQGEGTLTYRGKWNLFDQIIISSPLLEKGKKRYSFYGAGVMKSPMLLEQEGQYKGHPFRSYAGITYIGGYSDHLPVFIYLARNPR